MSKSPVFHVGLCLAGAVSAGAYTAGVIDYLLEALDNWESQRGKEGVPTHRVKIPVIGGASAGGMTGILAASAMHTQIPPVSTLSKENIFEKNPDNKFYHTWVDLLDDDMFPLLLETSDIKTKQIYSLLNSAFIDEVTRRVILSDPLQSVNRPYIEHHLKVFTTLSNLQGLPFNISFNSNAPGASRYIVRNHNDYACFILNKSEAAYEHDGWIPLDFKNLVNVNIAAQAAMATGAFPLGLRARRVGRNKNYVNDNLWLKPITKNNPVHDVLYETMNVDGGLINNEPFEKVRDVLTDITNQGNPDDCNDYNKFTSTVLMVDPFPSVAETFDPGDGLANVIGNTVAAMISQCRIKPSTLEQAMNSSMAGQFLIAPVRTVTQKDGTTKREQGSKAIACGSLSGFGGFLHKEFRIHDFFLGRANCEKFLRDHFTVPDDSTNTIVEGYAHLTAAAVDRLRAPQGGLPIIPVLTPRTAGKYMPTFQHNSDWPVRTNKDVERFSGAIAKRAQSIIMNIGAYGPLTKALLWIGAKVVLNRKLAEASLNTIKRSLQDHQLLP